MTARPALTPELSRTRVMAVLRSADASGLPATARPLAAGGVTGLEITPTTSGALDAVAEVRGELGPEVAVGADTVVTGAQARDALAAGAQFPVTPVDADVVRTVAETGVTCHSGAWTPTEASTAWRAGAAAVKLFPAATGGPAYLRQLPAPLPDLPIGVDIHQAREYTGAGAHAVGVGSPLLRGADRNPTSRHLDRLTERACALLEAASPVGHTEEAAR
ncbi:bifunctional 4-hydroxy-2-oxoglutarate aldolase/2-dehydro-3-deoxy-phosphogluconate aldolase [Streptomyces sp. S.PNR 29]|uniref:bifunctional 4-hydroxy-2-oxoglutarate aldolase/2-dehydro-3-deoxy-phosphogluconate aldolase n=1 Tax=Streptomyces sp. S.PNR 29 TaxID=2973805 RepID=UPI0025B0308E|nr:bifunctional 4-hydroxy-2-oxoglutarate aldolase/2-dehydro-3-deoxy-phosphogluconate aldolase [Streptomyces sp. S.PNR 29]MDN0199847.1 bifunctional 4-hydroxy-2-oxoglutarate aldolase/2-dehydro-3-deoxy-phosphogluconate aldolase [Streptomyces sp. S.PNR 29]